MKTFYTDDILKRAEWYVEGGWEEMDQATPTMAGLARELGCTRRVLYLWKEKHDEFRRVCDALQDTQELTLINGGLRNSLNSNIVKLMLANHGYGERSTIDHRSGDGSMSPKGKTLDDFYEDVQIKPES